jgi:serine/threonine protein kinase/Leucine-rich repeat (LRR) protein
LNKIPDTIGNYTIIKALGIGGMGEVWLGEDEYGHTVAIKCIVSHAMLTHRLKKRFQREAQALSSLTHNNICRIYGVQEIDEKLYLIMEYVDGITLSSLLNYITEKTTVSVSRINSKTTTDITTLIKQIQEEKNSIAADLLQPETLNTEKSALEGLPLQQTLALMRKLCDAVQYAHEHGILHRDIKPSNIIIRTDGEPVLVDFGVAKLFDKEKEERDDEMTDSLTITGQIFGTIHYMSPEQAKAEKDLDERTDVFSVGAVLYELVTGKKHFYPSGDIMKDVMNLTTRKIVKPGYYVKNIDKDLETILLTSLAIDREIRYRSARQLGLDIQRYQNGEPISARPPTLRYRTAKFVSRNKIPLALLSVLLLFIIFLGGYFTYEYMKTWANWIHVYHHDFTDGKFDPEEFEFRDRFRQPDTPKKIDSLGMMMKERSWCWLKDASVSGDVRIVVTFYINDPHFDGIDLIINARDDTLEHWAQVPPSYSAKFGGYYAILDFISFNHAVVPVYPFFGVESAYTGQETVQITFQRKGNTVSLFVDGKLQTSREDDIPLSGPAFSRIGLRTFTSTPRIQQIDVYRLSLPQKANPITTPDAFISNGDIPQAIELYLNIARDYDDDKIVKEALFKAYTATFMIDSVYYRSLGDSVRAVFLNSFSDTRYRKKFDEVMILGMWKNAEYETVIPLVDVHLTRYPESDIAVRTLYREIEQKPAVGLRKVYFKWFVKTKELTNLDVSFFELGSLEGIENKKLRRVSCKFNKLTDLEPLSDMQLEWLNCRGNEIHELTPLRGHPLKYLNCSYNHLSDLSPLDVTTLYRLYAQSNQIKDISILKNAPLLNINISTNTITSIDPLRGKKMVSVIIKDNTITDISALEGMPLRYLDCSNNDITHLDALAGCTTLTDILCAGNSIESLVPLAGIPLTVINCSKNKIESLEPLQNAGCQYINCADNPLQSLTPFLDRHPPDRFYYFSETIAPEAVREAIEAWSGDPAMIMHTRNARILLAIVENRIHDLKRFASEFNNRYYLFIPWHLRKKDASRLAQRAGGHIVSLNDKNEEIFVNSLSENRTDFWVDLYGDVENAHWRHGKESRYLIDGIKRDWGASWYYKTKEHRLSNYSEDFYDDGLYEFVIEWEN